MSPPGSRNKSASNAEASNTTLLTLGFGSPLCQEFVDYRSPGFNLDVLGNEILCTLYALANGHEA